MRQILEEFGLMVKHAREDKGWTRQDLADYAELDVRTVTKIEEGKGSPNMSTVMPIVHLLELSPSAVFSDIGLADKIKMHNAVKCMLELTYEQMQKVLDDAISIKKWKEQNDNML